MRPGARAPVLDLGAGTVQFAGARPEWSGGRVVERVGQSFADAGFAVAEVRAVPQTSANSLADFALAARHADSLLVPSMTRPSHAGSHAARLRCARSTRARECRTC